jgi:LPXTG-site transpeptidase (sortase) family protein
VNYLARVALLMVATLTLGWVLFLVVFGALEHQVRQARLYSHFRAALAAGTAPTGQADASGKHLLAMGTPVALLQIPSIHVHEVVGEGTTAEVLISGPGHRRDTPLPGQPGTSVIVGRQAAYGGPFRRIHQLKRGATIKVTVGFGTNQETFRVIDVRHAGDPRPPAVRPGSARLTLVTATGTPFLPHGLVYVDADLKSRVQPDSTRAITSPSQLMPSEVAGATDTSTLWVLVFWLQALLLVTIGAVWAWHRWGHAQTWIVFVPLLLVVGFFVSDQLTRLLPNVL